MVFGGVGEERVVLNENTLWSGSPQDADRPDAAKHLPEIRRLLVEGRNAEAEQLVYKNFTCRGPGSAHGAGKDAQYGSYQMLGHLRLKFAGGDAGASNYRRELDLSEAVARVIYEQAGRGYQREIFVSAPDQAVVMRLTADRPGVLSFDAALERPERATTVADGSNGLLMSGQLNDGKGGGGMKFAARLRVLNRGGRASVEGQSVRVRDADEATLVVTAATDYMGFA